MQAEVGRTRVAVAGAFAAQGLGFAVLLSHVPAFKDRYDIGDSVVTGVLFGVAVLAGLGTVAAERVAGRRGSGLVLRLALGAVALAVALIAVAPDLPLFFVGF